MTTTTNQNGCIGTFLGVFSGISTCGLLVIGATCLLCVSGLVLIGIGAAQQQEAIIEANAGRGTLDDPIPGGEWAVYDDVEIRLTRINRQADNEISQMAGFNRPAAAGGRYVLAVLEVRCKIERCVGNEFTIRAVTASGEYREADFTFGEGELDFQDAVRGGIMNGWQAFEVPNGEDIHAIMLRWRLQPSLYLATR